MMNSLMKALVHNLSIKILKDLNMGNYHRSSLPVQPLSRGESLECNLGIPWSPIPSYPETHVQNSYILLQKGPNYFET